MWPYLGPETRARETLGPGQSREEEKKVGVTGRSHFLSFRKKKKKLEVQSPEFRLSDHETESAKAEGPGS